ncbi:lipid-transfer protein [Chloroflexota bacterium]
MESIRDKTAIVGIGVHDFSKDAKLTRWDMMCRSVRAALDDAGLTPEDIDGIVQYKYEEAGTDEQSIARAMGMGNLTFWGDCPWGSGASCSLVLRAAMAVAAGVANNVVVVRARTDSSAPPPPEWYGGGREVPSGTATNQDFYNPFGLLSNTGRIAMIIRRYMHEYSINSDQFGWITTVCREHGAQNPNSIFYNEPITIKDYQGSKMVVEPLRSLDCYIEVDGAVALIVTTAERARRLKQLPVYIMAGAQSMADGATMMTSYYRPVISALPEIGNVGKKLFEMAGITQKDIDLVQLDDSYAPLVSIQLEELGFCGRGEGMAFCEGGNRIRVGAELPLNTSGGSLGEGHLYGMNHIAEGVRQIRSTSTAQVKNAKLALVITGAGGPASGLILRR